MSNLDLEKIIFPNDNNIYIIRDAQAHTDLANKANKDGSNIVGPWTMNITGHASQDIASTEKRQPGGVAELDQNGLIITSQLPSSVDEIIEGYYFNNKFYEDAQHTKEITGEASKIYIDLSTNQTYRWSGSTYVEISPSIALGVEHSTAGYGDWTNTAYLHAIDPNKISAAVASGLYKIAATSEGHVASLTAVTKADITALGIPAQLYGECTTDANVVAKTVTVSDFVSLQTGMTIYVKFRYYNSASNPTLNVNSSGAKAIRCRYSQEDSVEWFGGQIVSFTYDGTIWIMNDVGIKFPEVSCLDNSITVLTSRYTETDPTLGTLNDFPQGYGIKINSVDWSKLTNVPNYRLKTDNDFDTINVTELNAGDVVVTGVGRFTNGLYGNLTGNADTATKATQDGSGNVITSSYTPYKGNLNGTIGSGSPAADMKTYWDNNDNIKTNSVNTAYNNAGQEYAFLLSKGNSNQYGAVIRWGYATKYFEILRKYGSTWKDSDWVKMDAGYADTAGTATKATQDESGNNIKASYASSISISDHTITLKNKNGVSLGTVTVPDNATDNTKLPLAGGTMTGQIILASSALKTNESAGWTMNQYGNLVHQRATTTDYWAIANNAGTYKFQVYYETGAVTAAGNVTAPKFIGNLQGNADTATTASQLAEDISYITSGTSFVVHTTKKTFKTYLSRRNNLGISSATGGMMVLAGTWESGNYTSELALGMGDNYGIYYRGSNSSAEQAWQEVGRFTATPTSGRVMITDGTEGGMKSSSYTIATSVPSGAVFTDTKNTAGSTDTSSKIFLIGATSQAANPQTYSQDTAYVGTDGCLYSGGSKVLTAHQDISGKVSKAGDTMSGGLTVEASNSYSSYNEGIRINAGARTYATLLMGGTAGTTSGTNDGAFWIGVYNTGGTARRLMIAHNGSTATTTYFYTNANNTVTPSLRIGADLQVDGGTYVKSINYIGTKATTAMIRFIDNTTDAYGNGIYIGGGGQTVIGGGESASVAAANLGNSGAEVMYITNDNGNICFVPNTDSGWANRKESYFSANGDLFVNNSVHAVVYGVSPTNGTTGGISLYGGVGNVDNYGIAFRLTSNKGVHGYVQGNWATYFTMDAQSNRGWVFKNSGSTGNVASISNNGNAVFNGSVTVGGNAANTSGVRQVYNSTTKSLDFVFVA